MPRAVNLLGKLPRKCHGGNKPVFEDKEPNLLGPLRLRGERAVNSNDDGLSRVTVVILLRIRGGDA